ncbi:MAG: hypothetical protein K1X88_17400, partial [Nannocystaceae bacterium]|nr:hypothetical protein [Nannocystaceae bacterium]
CDRGGRPGPAAGDACAVRRGGALAHERSRPEGVRATVAEMECAEACGQALEIKRKNPRD